jgi:Tol biopolymer transport system component
LSHRGEKIAYVHVASERPRREAAAIYDVASGATRDVFEAAVIWSVAWSPDDSRLAAVADEAGSKGRSLYLIRPDMGQPAEGVYLNMDIKGVEYELSNYAPPSWSNSGDRLAIEFRRKGTAAGRGAAGMIGIWNPETKQLTKLADGVEPSWSPVEDEIAYFSPKRNKCVAVKAGEAQRVLFSVGKRGAGAGRGPLFFPIVWSADGKQVIFHQWVDADLITDVYRLDLTTGKSKKVARSELQVVGWRSVE